MFPIHILIILNYYYCFLYSFVNNTIEWYNKSKDSEQSKSKIDSRRKELNFIFQQLINIGCRYTISDTAQWNRIERTFRSVILNDDLYGLFNDYIEPILLIFINYFQGNGKRLLDVTLDLINTINLPELHCDRTHTQPHSIKMDYQSQSDEQLLPSSQFNPQERIETVNNVLFCFLNFS